MKGRRDTHGPNSTKSTLEAMVDTLGEILAFFTVLLILFLYINGRWTFLPPKTTEVLAYIREIAIIAVVGLSGFELAVKGNWKVAILFLVLVAAVVVFMFFPGAVPGWGN